MAEDLNDYLSSQHNTIDNWIIIFCLFTESGVGAGIDSYYEYLLKAYILLGDETYLDRFNKVSYVFFSHVEPSDYIFINEFFFKQY